MVVTRKSNLFRIEPSFFRYFFYTFQVQVYLVFSPLVLTEQARVTSCVVDRR